MKCPKCHIENPAENKFCRECGTALRSVCTICGSEIQIVDKFCGKCGQKLLTEEEIKTPEPSTDGERKHVTVLFSDLSGYTAMSEKMDPEEVKEIVNRIFGQIEQLCQEVCDENFALQRTYSAPGYIENPDDRLVDIIRQESKKLGYSSKNRFAGGRIDASIFKAVGHIPSYCMGAGNRDQMHLVDEYITVEDFIACSELVKNIVFSYLS